MLKATAARDMAGKKVHVCFRHALHGQLMTLAASCLFT